MTTRMVKLGLAGAVVAVVLGAQGVGRAQQAVADDPWCRDDGSRGDRARVCEVREFTVPAGAMRIAVDASPNGGIEVTGTDRTDMLVKAKVVASAESEARAREILTAVRTQVSADRVESDGPRELDRRESWSASYRIQVPTLSSLDLKTVNGGVDVRAVDGRIEFQTVNGGVRLASVAGSVRGRTTNGGVDVNLDGTVWRGEGLDVQTSNGGVRLAVPAGYSAQLEASTVNGGFNSDFPVTVQGRTNRQLQATLGAGGPLIRVQTHNGGVKVTRK
jgi:hypothetical protein